MSLITRVTSWMIPDGGVREPDIADRAITLAKLAAGTPGRAIGFGIDGQPAEVVIPGFGPGSITTGMYADRSVTLGKLAHGTPGKWLKYSPEGALIETDPPAEGGGGGTPGGSTYARIMFNVKDYGAIGNGVADDSAAVQACINAAKAAGGTVWIPEGAYAVPTLGVQSGRLFIQGDGDARIIGSLNYKDVTFPPLADTGTPISPTAPYLSIEGLSFQPIGTDWGLTIEGWLTDKYIQVGEVRDCAFYGRRGMRVRHAITFDAVNCRFHNTEYGLKFEGSTNCNVLECTFHNIGNVALWMTAAPSGEDLRRGGENVRVANCDFGVCSTAIRCEHHNWLRVDNTLIDYTGLPLDLRGSSYAQCGFTYFGSSGTYANLVGLAGYQAPPETRCVRAVPTTSYGTMPVGASFDGCEFVDYGSTAVPNIRVDGSAGGTISGRPAQRWSFTSCVFWKYSSGVTHQAPCLVDLKAVAELVIANCFFFAPNGGNAYQNAYLITNCVGVQVGGNVFHHSRRDNMATIVASQLETPTGTLRPFKPDPGIAGGAVLRPAALAGTPTFDRGVDFTESTFTSGSAMHLAAGHWLTWAGVHVLGRMGTSSQVRSNGAVELVDGNGGGRIALRIDPAWNGNPVFLYLTGKLRQIGIGPAIDSNWNYLICGN